MVIRDNKTRTFHLISVDPADVAAVERDVLSGKLDKVLATHKPIIKQPMFHPNQIKDGNLWIAITYARLPS